MGEVVCKFPLGRVGCRAREFEQFLLPCIVEHPTMRQRFWTLIRKLSLAGTDDEADGRGDSDAEVLSNLSLGPTATGAGFDDLLSEVQGVGGRHDGSSGRGLAIHT